MGVSIVRPAMAATVPSSADSAANALQPQNRTIQADLAPNLPSRVCGTGPPSRALVKLHHKLNSAVLNKRLQSNGTKYTINTYFHVVSTHDQKNLVTKQMISKQLGTLQAAYAPSNIAFNLISTDFTINDAWATDADDGAMKAALRKGNYSTLNVYFQSNLSTFNAGSSSQLIGYCTLPTNITYSPCSGCALATFPAADYVSDGCNVLAGSMPGGNLIGYNQGKTAVHEIGHWFGLLHTFQDNSCASGDSGDFIDDTPQQSLATTGCPVGKDSCPGDPGLDPIQNYMDYSTDAW